MQNYTGYSAPRFPGTMKPRWVEYTLNGERHRTDGPAYISYKLNGLIEFERYMLHGKPHRIDGPAIIHYHHPKGIKKKFYLDGQLYPSQQAHAEAVRQILASPALRLTDPRQWVRELKTL